MSEIIKKLMGYIGVDSGMVWIGDPCYTQNYENICNEMKNNSYKSFNYEAGHEGLGICTENPYGDGMYPVYGLFKEGKDAPHAIIIDFDGEV